jgi:hypothetical protein
MHPSGARSQLRTELAVASARLGPERAEMAQKRLRNGSGTAMKRLRDGWSVIFHHPQILGNGLDHEVGLGVGYDGRTLWLVVGSLNERRGRVAAANRALIKFTNY